MKPLIKYPITLVILLLVGYTQGFAHLYRVNAIASVKKINHATHVQTLALGTAGVEDIYIEEEEVEEDDRLTLKKHFTDYSVFSYASALAYFHPKNISYSCVSKNFSSYASFQSPYLLFRVFRL